MKITEGRRRAGGAADRPEVVRIRSALLDGVSAETSGRTDEERARVLLADLLDWHPRDDKPAWWRHFYLRTLSPAELIGEPDALGGLTGGEVVGQVRKSLLRRFFFPPQEYKFSTGDTACDPATDKQWTVCDVDDARRVSGGDAATALLLRRPPDDGGGAAGSLRAEGETASAAAVRLAVSLRDSYLPMQGPPGTGKTYTAALRAGPKLMFEA